MPEVEEVTIEPKIAKKSEIDQKAEEIKAKRKLPPKPGDRVTLNEMCEWLKLLAPEMKERILLYVYRLEPVINRQLVDPTTNNSIDIISDGFELLDEDYFSRKHGGGKYKVIVFDAGTTEMQRNGYFSSTFTITMLDNPPNLDYREVEWDNPKNKGFKAWARGQRLIDENNMPVMEKKSGSGDGNSPDAMVQAMKLAMDFASKMDDKQQAQLKRQLGAEDTLGKSIGDILLEKMKQEDPNKQMATLSTILGAVKGMIPESKPDNTMVPLLTMITEGNKQMFAAMMESSKLQMQMMMQMFTTLKESNGGGSVKEVDDTERLKNLLEIARMMKGGASSIPEKSMTEQLIEAGTTLLPPVFNLINNVMVANAAAKGVSGMAGGIKQAPQSQVQQTQTSAFEQMNQANKQAVVEQQELPAATAGSNLQMTLQAKQNALKQFTPLIMKSLSQNKEGWEFAGDVEALYGVEVVAFLIKDGEEELINIAKNVPEFWNPVVETYGEAHLKKWVNQFVHYKELIAKMEEEENNESSVQ